MLDLILVDIKLFCHKYLKEVPTAFLTVNICRYDVQCSHFIYRNMNYMFICILYNRFQGRKLT